VAGACFVTWLVRLRLRATRYRVNSTLYSVTAREARWSGLVLALALCLFLFWWAQDAWTNYWLLKDAQQGCALVMREHWSGHDNVVYRYVVGQREYIGQSSRNGKDAKKVQVGERAMVYFSASHPWLSRLSMPENVLVGLPVIVLVLVLAVFAVITFIKPKALCAFNWRQKREKDGV
jgi:hypothetical protein